MTQENGKNSFNGIQVLFHNDEQVMFKASGIDSQQDSSHISHHFKDIRSQYTNSFHDNMFMASDLNQN